MPYALGIDLGGSSVKAVAVAANGRLLNQANIPFNLNEQFDWARRIQQIVIDLDATARGGDVSARSPQAKAVDLSTPHSAEGRGGFHARAIGISAPGLAARDGCSIAVMPGRLHGLEGLDWTTFLKVEPLVPVLNDAHAALLGEAWLGAARGFKNVFMLTLGTGVGGAAIVDGRLLKGALGRAGHLGHVSLDLDGPRDVCGMPGSLEALIGNYSIEQRTGGRFKTTHDLVAAHGRGEAFATEIWMKSVRALGYAISSLVNVLDPEAVIIGGGIARSGTALFEPLERFVRDTEWDVGAPVRILPAQLGDLAGAYGAAWNALKEAGVFD